MIVDDLITYEKMFFDNDSGYSVVFEDNGRVAYGYLLDPNKSIVGDVWLYNRCESPLEPEWKNPEKMPFANPIELVKGDIDFHPPTDISEITVEWGKTELSDVKAKIFFRNKLFAVLIYGSKPGWSVMAKKDGPLAKVLEVV